jgi:(p)ppGpp synthase/HD superfamily hydrolase
VNDSHPATAESHFADTALILRAAHFAATKHTNQRRKNGDIPYINHPIGVASIPGAEGGVHDGAAIAAALLHDTVEDTATTPEELTEESGEEIASIVAEVTDDKSRSKLERKKTQVTHASELSEKARWVKLADKIYNLRDLATNPPPNWD